MKVKIILNPVSGNGSGFRRIPKISELAEKNGLDCEIIQTQRIGHAIQLAETAVAEGCEVIVAAGGDGTVNEVINGMMHAHTAGKGESALGVLPIGKGNDFAFSVGIPSELEASIQCLVNRKTYRMDIGYISGGRFPEGRYFGNGIGVGFDTIVGFESAKLKWVSGFLSYAIAAVKTIVNGIPVTTLRISLDDQEIQATYLMVSMMNGRRMGGGFMMAPDSLQDDSLFDLCLVKSVSRREMVRLIPMFMKGTQRVHPQVQFLRSSKIYLRAIEGVIPAHADGETICEAGEELRLHIIPSALNVISNRG